MKEAVALVTYIVTQITGDPECFHIDESIDENGALLSLSIDQKHAGRIIGKGGTHAQSIRVLLRALGHKNNANYKLKIDVWESKEGQESL